MIMMMMILIIITRSPLIRHPSTLDTGSCEDQGSNNNNNNSSVISTENNQFLKDVGVLKLIYLLLSDSAESATSADQILTVCVQVVEQVLAGEGVGWLKLGKLRKLMEDENYRVILLSKLVSSMEVKVTPDDHIQDVVSTVLS